MKCVTCNGLFPPGMTEFTEDGKAAKCHFCIQDKKKIEFVDPESGQSVTYSKQHVIDEYDRYLKQVSENPDVKKLIVDDAVKKMKDKY